MEKKPRILFIAPLPPPVHGSAVVSRIIKDSARVNAAFDSDFVNLSTSRELSEIGQRGMVKYMRACAVFFTVLRKLTTQRYDLCYIALTCHGKGFLKDAPVALLCKLFRRPLVIHQHNKGMSADAGRWPYRWLLPLVYKTSRVILLSEHLYDDISSVVSRDQVLICPNGLQDEALGPKLSEEVPHIMFLSNLIASKGVLVLLDALHILSERGVDAVCDIVGAESAEISKSVLEGRISQLGLDGKVFYHGRLTGDDKEKIWSKASVLAFPTRDECFPLVLIEALQHSVPVVTSDVGGIPDIVSDSMEGFVTDPGDPEALADALARLVSDGMLAKKMGEKGRRKYEGLFTLDIFEEKLIECLELSMERRPADTE